MSQGINLELHLSLLVAVLILQLLDGLRVVQDEGIYRLIFVVHLHILLLGLLRDGTEELLLVILR